MVFGGNQTRKNLQSTVRQYNVVESASKRLAAAFDDAQAPALGAIFRCDFPKMDDAMRYAVSRPLPWPRPLNHPGREPWRRVARSSASGRGAAAGSAMKTAPRAGFLTGCRKQPAQAMCVRLPQTPAASSRLIQGRMNKAGSAAAFHPGDFLEEEARICRCR